MFSSRLKAGLKLMSYPKRWAVFSGITAASFCSFSSAAETKPRPLVLAGPSGVGKGTLVSRLLKDHPQTFQLSSSHTTRNPRPGEIHGVHYWFVTREEFLKGIEEQKFIEYNEFSGNLYGTSTDAVKSVQDQGKICLLDIDINGCKAFKTKGFDARFVFIAPPPPEFAVLEQRLRGRGTDTPEALELRLKTAKAELQFLKENPSFFHKIIINDDIDKAYIQLQEFLKDEMQ